MRYAGHSARLQAHRARYTAWGLHRDVQNWATGGNACRQREGQLLERCTGCRATLRGDWAGMVCSSRVTATVFRHPPGPTAAGPPCRHGHACYSSDQGAVHQPTHAH